MSRICYGTGWSPSPDTFAIVETANEIIEEYQGQGYTLTLRQLYYQFVARDLLANKQREYKRLGEILNRARMEGLVDWDAIEDRTRFLREVSTWESPQDIVAGAAAQFRLDKWAEQSLRIEVWIEKDALIGVIEGVCEEAEVPYLACRGYVSQSEAWRAGRRIRGYLNAGQDVVILHLGDHDPSGIDMTRDNDDRLTTFSRAIRSNDETSPRNCWVERLALNYEQIEEHGPPPNPTKTTDSRAAGYIAQYGNESWELDALEPAVIAELVADRIQELRDPDAWDESELRETAMREELEAAAEELSA